MQELTARAMLDSFLAASGFGVDVNALDLSKPCEPLELIDYVTTETMAGACRLSLAHLHTCCTQQGTAFPCMIRQSIQHDGELRLPTHS